MFYMSYVPVSSLQSEANTYLSASDAGQSCFSCNQTLQVHCVDKEKGSLLSPSLRLLSTRAEQ